MNIFEFLNTHQNLLPANSHIKYDDTELVIKENSIDYLTVTKSKISMFGIDMLLKLQAESQNNWNKFDSYFTFLKTIKNDILRLNHCGFGYRVLNVDKELQTIKSRLPANFELVEEDSGDKPNNRWFFIKHKTDSSVPKIELVLYFTEKYREFYPQFQLDIDTGLSFESIRKISDELFGKNFFFWKYEVPGYGVVMAMGKIAQISGINILIGIGTNLRKRQSFQKT